jgi:pyridoxine 4-dehydrogenase
MMTKNTIDTLSRPAVASGMFQIGDDMTVARLGYGAMRITGPGVWGEPRDRGEAIRVLRRAVELGVTFIDTADSYGPYISEELIREALHPYPRDLAIATKAGLVRTGPSEWHPLGRPEYLRQEVEMSLRRLGLERIDLFQLHRIDPQVPLEDQVGALADLQREGKIRHIGLSNVSVEETRRRARSRRSSACRTATIWPTVVPKACLSIARKETWLSSLGSPLPPAHWHVQADRWTASPTDSEPLLRSSRWRGC